MKVGDRVIVNLNVPEALSHFCGNTGTVDEIMWDSVYVRLDTPNYVRADFYFTEVDLYEEAEEYEICFP